MTVSGWTLVIDYEHVLTLHTESDDEDDDVEMGADTDALAPSKPSNSALPTTATSSPFLPSILQPLLTLIQPTPLSFPPLPNPTSAVPIPLIHPPTTSALSAIHITAFECLNNIFLALALSVSEKNNNSSASDIVKDVRSGVMVWDAIWAALGGVGVETVGILGQEKRREVWEVAVGVLWGVGSVWKGALVSGFIA